MFRDFFELFMFMRFPDEPKDSAYWKEWYQRFYHKNAVTYMDFKSLRVYKKCLKFHLESLNDYLEELKK